MTHLTAAQVVVKCLEAQGVEYIFGIPGAKIDAVFDALNDSKIQLVVCRHEQNAAFMAAAYGRLTQKPGVVLVTSGPGVSNLTTGLLTATTEGDPIVAIGGNAPRPMLLKEVHQNAENSRIMAPVTKSSVEVYAPENIPEVIANAFRIAAQPRSGACFISLPQDILAQKIDPEVIKPLPFSYGVASKNVLAQAADFINQARFPVVLLGQEASRPKNTAAIRALLKKTSLPTVGTYQAAGVVSRELLPCFAGRIGLFQNQPGDQLLEKTDLIITIGFNSAEYDPEIWNAKRNKTIVHLDYIPAKIHLTYQPAIEVLGEIDENLEQLTGLLDSSASERNRHHVQPFHTEYKSILDQPPKNPSKTLVHPLSFIHALRAKIDDEAIVVCDIGSIYMWMARYFLSFNPHHLLFSNGQQTLGVALPWAMGANFACPHKKVISMSGDGGFLFSAMELENAVRHNCQFVHFIWTDGSYDMVKEQELMKYHRPSGVQFGKVDIVDFASAFGAKGYSLKNAQDLEPLMDEALRQKGPVLVDIPIDYSDNPKLFQVNTPKEIH